MKSFLSEKLALLMASLSIGISGFGSVRFHTPGVLPGHNTKKGTGRKHLNGGSIRKDKEKYVGYPGAKLARQAANGLCTVRNY